MVATIGADSFIVLVSIVEAAVLGIFFLRLWALRDQPRTYHTYYIDGALAGFVALFLGIGILLILSSLEEKQVLSKYSDAEEIALHLGTSYLKKAMASSLMYTTQLWLIKGAFMMYYLRLKKHLSRAILRLLYITITFIAMSFIVMAIAQLAACRPFERNWAPAPENCQVLQSLWGSTLQAWLNFVSDMLVLTTSIFIISSLQLGHRERIALFWIASLGLVSILMCLVRFIEVYLTITHPSRLGSHTLDGARALYMWGTFEVTFAFIAFCLPSFRVLFRNTAILDSNATPVLSTFHRRLKMSGYSNATKRSGDDALDMSLFEQTQQSRHSRASLHSQGHDEEWNFPPTQVKSSPVTKSVLLQEQR